MCVFQMWRNSQFGIIWDLHWHAPFLLPEICLLNSEMVVLFIKYKVGVGHSYPSPHGTHALVSLILKGVIP